MRKLLRPNEKRKKKRKVSDRKGSQLMHSGFNLKIFSSSVISLVSVSCMKLTTMHVRNNDSRLPILQWTASQPSSAFWHCQCFIGPSASYTMWPVWYTYMWRYICGQSARYTSYRKRAISDISRAGNEELQLRWNQAAAALDGWRAGDEPFIALIALDVRNRSNCHATAATLWRLQGDSRRYLVAFTFAWWSKLRLTGAVAVSTSLTITVAKAPITTDVTCNRPGNRYCLYGATSGDKIHAPEYIYSTKGVFCFSFV